MTPASVGAQDVSEGTHRRRSLCGSARSERGVAGPFAATIAPMDTGLVSEIVNGNWGAASTGKPRQLALRIFLAAARQFIDRLRRLYREFEDVEDLFEEKQSNEDAIALLNIQKQPAYCIQELHGNAAVLERLRRSRLFREMPPEDLDLLEDAIRETRLAVETAETAAGFLNQAMSAFASIVSDNLSAVMRFLAAVTLALTVPMTSAGFLGMNYRLPFQEGAYGFAFSLGLAALLTDLSLLWLRRKRYSSRGRRRRRRFRPSFLPESRRRRWWFGRGAANRTAGRRTGRRR